MRKKTQKTSRKQRISHYKRHIVLHWRFFLVLGAVLVIALTAFGIVGHYYLTHIYDSSAHGEEAIEMKQNKVPEDVLAKIMKEQQTLGVNSKKNQKSLPLSVTVPILMYHYVEYVQDKGDKIRISLNTTPYTLEQEIITLKQAGYTFMTNKDLNDVLDAKASLPQKPILLTFDDGYRDFYTDAYPILKKYNVKATNYVIAGFLNYQNHLLTTQLQEIASDGLVEIGAHTVHHIWLKGQPLTTVQSEVTQSKKMLEDIIHKPVVSFAYPFGAFDSQAIDVVKQAGFDSAVSTVPGVDQMQVDRYFLFRVRPGGRVGQDLLNCLDNIPVCYNLKN